jgi:hypothetical protein
MKLRKCTAEAIGTFWLTFGVGCHRNRGPRTLEVNMRPEQTPSLAAALSQVS